MNASCPTPGGSTASITLPPVECAPWCKDGTGHVGAWHPSDQYCISESGSEDVDLTAMPLLGDDDGRYRDTIGAYLLREYNAIAPTVELVHSDYPVAKLTPAEAIELGRLLVRLGETAGR